MLVFAAISRAGLDTKDVKADDTDDRSIWLDCPPEGLRDVYSAISPCVKREESC